MQALADFTKRIKEYEKVYEPLTDGKSNRHVHFIQLVDIITGRGHIDINRISGYIPGKIVFFLMQVYCSHTALANTCAQLSACATLDCVCTSCTLSSGGLQLQPTTWHSAQESRS
jgi:6-phosphofructo-2-kinase